MNAPQCHRCGSELIQVKLTEDSEVEWYCIGCDADKLGPTEEASTKIEEQAKSL